MGSHLIFCFIFKPKNIWDDRGREVGNREEGNMGTVYLYWTSGAAYFQVPEALGYTLWGLIAVHWWFWGVLTYSVNEITVMCYITTIWSIIDQIYYGDPINYNRTEKFPSPPSDIIAIITS